MIISIDAGVAWPVVLFERDGYGLVVHSREELEGAYEEGMWDEVADGFDAAQHRLIPQLSVGSVQFRREERPDAEAFRVKAAESLGVTFRETRFRRVRAAADERALLDRASPSELLAILVVRQRGDRRANR